MSEAPKRKKRNAVYRSPESRARQLAGLSGVKIEKHVPGVVMEKVNGQGALTSGERVSNTSERARSWGITQRKLC